MTPDAAISLFVLLSLAGIGTAWSIGSLLFVLAPVMWLVGVLYNVLEKRLGIVGNLMVNACVAGSFLFGGIARSLPIHETVLVLTTLSFVASLALETAGDINDTATGSRSLTVRHGVKAALILYSSTLVAFTVLAVALPVTLSATRIIRVTIPAAAAFLVLGARFVHIHGYRAGVCSADIDPPCCQAGIV